MLYKLWFGIETLLLVFVSMFIVERYNHGLYYHAIALWCSSMEYRCEQVGLIDLGDPVLIA